MEDLEMPVDLIWGEKDPWEPINAAKKWMQTIECIQSFLTIPNAGHCPHDEACQEVNIAILLILKAVKAQHFPH